MLRHFLAVCLASSVSALAGRSFFRQRLKPLTPLGPLEPLSAGEHAFIDLVTVAHRSDPAKAIEEAVRTFERFGIVRIPHTLTPSEAGSAVSEAAELQPELRNAYGQLSQADRYSLWLANAERSLVPSESDSVLHRVMDGDLATLWRSCVASLGASHVALAEVVTSCPGGSAQMWHQDGAGVTLQLALCQIDVEQGPTEVRPRPFAAEYALAFTQSARFDGVQLLGLDVSRAAGQQAAEALHKLQRPLYELTTAVHTAVWSGLRDVLSREQAKLGMELSLLPPPPSVRLTADVGMLTIYDSAMQHRGGANRGDYARPILAVHMREDMSYSGSQVGASL